MIELDSHRPAGQRSRRFAAARSIPNRRSRRSPTVACVRRSERRAVRGPDGRRPAPTEAGITAVVTDASEEYNPLHDVCRALTECAVAQCGANAPRLWELDLIGDPRGSGTGVRLQLDDAAFGRKLDAVKRYQPLAAEAAFDVHGIDAFRTEFLREAAAMQLPPSSHVPHYERIGDERVRAGRYDTTLRYGQHVRAVVLTALLNGR